MLAFVQKVDQGKHETSSLMLECGAPCSCHLWSHLRTALWLHEERYEALARLEKPCGHVLLERRDVLLLCFEHLFTVNTVFELASISSLQNDRGISFVRDQKRHPSSKMVLNRAQKL